jgi:hypothetical protein
MKRQIKTSSQKISDFILKRDQILLILMKNYEVICVSQIIFCFKSMFGKLIQFVHVNIGKHLGCQIADRGALDAGFLIGIGSETIDNDSHQIQNILILNSVADYIQQNLVVDGWEKLPDVALERKALPFRLKNLACVYAQLFYSLVSSFLFSARIRIGYKGRFKNRVKDTENRVVDDPVSDGGFMDMPQLRITNIKIDILAVSISFMDQIAMKLKNIIPETPFKKLDIVFFTLPAFKLVPCFEKILYRDNLPE